MYDLYCKEFEKMWNERKSLIIASEGLDVVASNPNGARSIVEALPWIYGTSTKGTMDDVTLH